MDSQPNLVYPGDSPSPGEKLEDSYRALAFEDPAILVSFFDKQISDGAVTLHKWQLEELQKLAAAKPTSDKPYRYCLVAANGSGKDKFIIAPFATWFTLCKIRARCIITTSSGSQLTSQTEPYIKDLCGKVNEFFKTEIFRIRQRYIYCLLTGSEIRMFATDEKGKAEGYHPIDPGAEMAIIVNEGKSVTEDIHTALRRCSGFNYWVEVSSPGEPTGFFYRSAIKWPNTRIITSYDCAHVSQSEIDADKEEFGEHSFIFRSKHLALFTSIGGDVIIPDHLIESLINNKVEIDFPSLELQIGIDVAAGGDENSMCFVKGSKCLRQVSFREVDTTITADRFEHELQEYGLSKDFSRIYADDGGVGHSVIDQLVRKGWKINRVLNQSAAIKRKQFANRGAENWYRVKRILEERLFDITSLDQKTISQLKTRHYKQAETSGRIALESKKEAISKGRPSPDRADAFVLAFTGLNIDAFLDTKKVVVPVVKETRFKSMDEAAEHYEKEITYGIFSKKVASKRIFNSLRAVYGNN